MACLPSDVQMDSVDSVTWVTLSWSLLLRHGRGDQISSVIGCSRCRKKPVHPGIVGLKCYDQLGVQKLWDGLILWVGFSGQKVKEGHPKGMRLCPQGSCNFCTMNCAYILKWLF